MYPLQKIYLEIVYLIQMYKISNYTSKNNVTRDVNGQDLYYLKDQETEKHTRKWMYYSTICIGDPIFKQKEGGDNATECTWIILNILLLKSYKQYLPYLKTLHWKFALRRDIKVKHMLNYPKTLVQNRQISTKIYNSVYNQMSKKIDC